MRIFIRQLYSESKHILKQFAFCEMLWNPSEIFVPSLVQEFFLMGVSVCDISVRRQRERQACFRGNLSLFYCTLRNWPVGRSCSLCCCLCFRWSGRSLCRRKKPQVSTYKSCVHPAYISCISYIAVMTTSRFITSDINLLHSISTAIEFWIVVVYYLQPVQIPCEMQTVWSWALYIFVFIWSSIFYIILNY